MVSRASQLTRVLAIYNVFPIMHGILERFFAKNSVCVGSIGVTAGLLSGLLPSIRYGCMMWLKRAICMGLVTKMSAVMSREDEIAVRRKYDNRWFVEAIPLWARQKGCVCVKNGDGFDGYVVVIGLALQPTKSTERINYIEELKDEEYGRNHGDRVATEALLPPSIWRSGIVSQIKGKRDAGAAICNRQKQ